MKLAFVLQTETGASITCERIIQKSAGLVAIGTVTKGPIIKGSRMSVQSDSSMSLSGTIKRIESYDEPIESAKTGERIGICLDEMHKDDLIRYLGR